MGFELHICIGVLGLVFLPYVAYQIILDFCCKTQDLKKRYDARWGLVTGASSGISFNSNLLSSRRVALYLYLLFVDPTVPPVCAVSP